MATGADPGFSFRGLQKMMCASSVASFFKLVFGGQDPAMYRQKIYVLILRERAKRASASETYISGLKYICIHMQSMQFHLITYGMAL